MDISFNISPRPFKFVVCTLEVWMQGSVSRTFYLDPSFDFIECRNFVLKKIQKVTRFLT